MTEPPIPSPPHRLSLELERNAEPIAGRLLGEDGASWSFTGWLELTRALEQARGADSSGEGEAP